MNRGERGLPRRVVRRASVRAGLSLLALFLLTASALGDSPPDVVVNEVAWIGTAASTSDEWIELKNNTGREIDLRGWTLKASDGTPSIALSGTLLAEGFYLLERTDDTTVSDIVANQIYTGTLADAGETLILRDASGATVDTANGDGGPWPAGATAGRATMERVNPAAPDRDSNWRTNDGTKTNGKDANGNPLTGTPKEENSSTNPPQGAFVFFPDPASTWDVVEFLDQSSDRDGVVVSWDWSFGDGGTSAERNPSHRYRSPGTYRVTLDATDDDGLVGSAQRELAIATGKGDVDGSGTVDVVDVRIVLQAALGLIDFTQEEFARADVDLDGDVDQDDARLLAEHVIGLSGH